MTKYLKVEGREDLVRETNSKAILSTDLKKLQEHREMRKNYSQTVWESRRIKVSKKK